MEATFGKDCCYKLRIRDCGGICVISEEKMLKENYILLGKAGDKEIRLLPNMLNRHGLIAGASGTGKTVTLKVIAESLSQLGVSTFIADV